MKMNSFLKISVEIMLITQKKKDDLFEMLLQILLQGLLQVSCNNNYKLKNHKHMTTTLTMV